MARQKPTQKPVVEEPVTRLPRRYKPAPSVAAPLIQPKPGPPAPAKPPVLPTVGNDISHYLLWVASCGTPERCDALTPYWHLIHEKLQQLKLRGDKNAIASLPDAVKTVSFNGDGLAGWIRQATKDNAASLQQLYAAMRLRIRHANWLRKKRG